MTLLPWENYRLSLITSDVIGWIGALAAEMG